MRIHKDNGPQPQDEAGAAARHQQQDWREALRRLDGGWGDPQLRRYMPTGLPALDAVLPGGGLPLGAVCECLGEEGAGRTRFVLWVLSRLLPRDPRWVLLVDTPTRQRQSGGSGGDGGSSGGSGGGEWYPPAFAQAGLDLTRLLVVRPRTVADALWAAEQGLGEGTCAAVVLREPRRLGLASVRRLQLAAEASSTLVLLLRRSAEEGERSASAVRLRFRAEPAPLCQHQPYAQRFVVDVLRCRGGPAGAVVEVTVQQRWLGCGDGLPAAGEEEADEHETRAKSTEPAAGAGAAAVEGEAPLRIRCTAVLRAGAGAAAQQRRSS